MERQEQDLKLTQPEAIQSNNGTLLENLRRQQLDNLASLTKSIDYIAVQGAWQPASEDKFDLENQVERFVENERKVLLILGDSGAGKSSFCQQWVKKRWDQFTPAKPVPLFIALPSLKDPIHSLMEETLKCAGISPEQISVIKQTRSFILILDGYDEMRQLQNLYVTNCLAEWQVKIIITCRTQFLYHVDNYTLYFMPFEGEKRQGWLYSEMHVKPFSVEQIKAYIQQYVKQHDAPWQDWKAYEQHIDKIPNLRNLIQNPFLLRITMEILPTIVAQYQAKSPDERLQLTQASLYDAFVEHWFILQEQKLKANGQIPKTEDWRPKFWSYAKALAKEMLRQRVSQIQYEPTSSLFGEEAEESPWDKFFNDTHAETGLLRTACPLHKVGHHHYAFMHTSLTDYFATRDMYESLTASPEMSKLESVNQSQVKEDKQEVAKNIYTDTHIVPSELLQEFINQRLFTLESRIIQFLADRVQADEVFKRKLFTIIEYSKQTEKIQIAAANAITILNTAKIPFSEMDLQKIRVSHADLSYGIFDHVQLLGADLRYVNFTGTWLRQSNLANTQMEGVQFGELPYLKLESEDPIFCSSPDGKWLVEAVVESTINEIKLYDANTLSLKTRMELSISSITCIAFSCHELLAVGSANTIRLWNINEKKLLRILEGSVGEISTLNFSPSGNEIAAAGEDKIVYLWDVKTGKLKHTFEGQHEKISSVVFSPNGHWLAVGCGMHSDKETDDVNNYNAFIYLWDLNFNRLIHSLPMRSLRIDKLALAFSPNSQFLVSGASGSGFCNDSDLRLWAVQPGELIRTFEGHQLEICSVAFSPDGRFIASGSADSTVRLWEMDSGKEIDIFNGHKDYVKYVAFNSDGKRIISGEGTGISGIKAIKTVRQWIVKDNVSNKLNFDVNKLFNIREHVAPSILAQSQDVAISLQRVAYISLSRRSARGYAYSQDGQYLAMVQGPKDDQSICIYDLAKDTLIHKFDAHLTTARSLAINQQQILVSGTPDGKLSLWHIDSKQLLHTLEGHAGDILCVAFSPDGQRLISGSFDHSMRVWDVANGNLLHVFAEYKLPILSVTFSPDGRYIASGHIGSGTAAYCTGDIVCLWSAATYELQSTIRVNNEAFINWPHYLAFSPDSHWIAVGSANQTVSIWEVSSGKCLHILRFFNSPMLAVGWVQNPQGIFLVTGGEDNNVSYWKVIEEKEKIRVVLYWSLFQTSLMLDYVNFHQAVGLDAINYNLLKQRGDDSFAAVSDPDAKVAVEEIEKSSAKINWFDESLSATEVFSNNNNLIEKRADDIEKMLTVSDVDEKILQQRLIVSESKIMEIFIIRAQKQETFKKLLFNWIYASKNNSSMRVAAANAISILVKSGVNFNGSDLQGIHIPHADLSYGLFERVDFSNADLTNVQFIGAHLRFAKFNKCQMRGVNFGEQSYLIHKDVRCIHVLTDGKLLASAGQDKIIRLWDIATKKCLKILIGHTDAIHCVQLSADGNLLASGSQDNTIRLWEVTTGKCITTLSGHTLSVRYVRFSPDNKQLVSVSEDATVRLWDVATGFCKKIITTECRRFSCNAEFSADARYLVTGGKNDYRDKSVRLWDINTGECIKIFEGHTNSVEYVQYSPDAQYLATGSQDETIRIWNVLTGECVKVLKEHIGAIECLQFSPDGKWIASGGADNTIRLWDVATGKCVAIYHDRYHINAIQFLPNSQQLVSITSDDYVHFWELIKSPIPLQIETHTDSIQSVHQSHNGQWLVTGSGDKTIRLWGATTGQHIKTILGHSKTVNCVRFSKNDQYLASSDVNTILLWDTSTSKCLMRSEADEYAHPWGVLFSPDGQWLASCGLDRTHSIQLQNILAGDKHAIKLKGHTEKIYYIEFSPNSEYLISGSGDKMARLWHVATGKCIKRLDDYFAMDLTNTPQFSPDGKLLAFVIKIAKDNNQFEHKVRLWNIEADEILAEFSGFTNIVNNLQFSPNSQWLAVCDWDGNMHLWDIPKKQRVTILKNFRKPCFSPDNKLLIAVNGDGIIGFWEVATQSQVGMVDAHVGLVSDIQCLSNSQSAVICSDKTLQVWGWEFNKEQKLELYLKWTSYQAILNVEGADISNANGLTADQRMFLTQRDALADSAIIKQQQFVIKTSTVILPDFEQISTSSQDKDIWMNYGLTLLNIQEYAAAIFCFKNVITLDGKESLAWFNSSLCYMQLAQYREAVLCYDKMLTLDKDDYTILRFRGTAFLYLNEFDTALECFNELLKNSTNKPVYTPCFKGFILLLQKNYQSAENLFEQVLENDNNFYLAFLGKGLITHIQYKQQDLTKQYFQRAENNAPNLDEKIEMFFIQGKILMECSFIADARLAFERALKLRANYEPVLKEIAKIPSFKFSNTEKKIPASSALSHTRFFNKPKSVLLPDISPLQREIKTIFESGYEIKILHMDTNKISLQLLPEKSTTEVGIQQHLQQLKEVLTKLLGHRGIQFLEISENTLTINTKQLYHFLLLQQVLKETGVMIQEKKSPDSKLISTSKDVHFS